MKRRHYTQILFLALVLANGSVRAQTEEPRTINSLNDSAWALQFQIAGNFTLSNFQGTAISVKRHYSNRIAVRVGISGWLDFRRMESSVSETLQTTQVGESGENAQYISFLGQYLVYPNPDANVNVFFGGGPVFTFSRSYRDSKSIPSTQYQASRSKGWAIGGTGVFGVEWFASKEFSLHAEYGVSLQYFWDSGTIETRLAQGDRLIQKQENIYKSWRFYGNSVRFGLSVYL